MVQDANLLNNGGVSGIDLPGGTSPVGPTVFNGLYVSDDFGKTWSVMATGTELASDPTSGSALIGTGTATGYQPGVQSWYNEWVQPDPSRSDANGVPTRLAFGLEEIWTNEPPDRAPLDGTTPAKFRVAAKYFGGDSCLLLSRGLPACPADRDRPTTTDDPPRPAGRHLGHRPLRRGRGAAVRRQRRRRLPLPVRGRPRRRARQRPLGRRATRPGSPPCCPTSQPWPTTAPSTPACRTTATCKIEAGTRAQYETYGGDGFYAAVDPFDSETAYEEYTNGAISVTTDGGKGWASIDPGLTAAKFSTPFVMDATDANHLATAGREVVETLNGSSTSSGMTDAADSDSSTDTWIKVFDLGTRSHPGDPDASASSSDPDNSMSAIATRKGATYVGYCGQCDTLNKTSADTGVFRNGLATNVGGTEPGEAGTAKGWHVVRPRGLPNRYVTSLAIDPRRKKTVYATLGGYTRAWLPPGATGDTNPRLGRGHLFVSRDGGHHFRDISGNLPDSPATSVTLREGQLLVGTDVGAFATDQTGTRSRAPRFGRLSGLPRAPIGNIALKPDNPNVAVLAMFGRGVWTYRFRQRVQVPDQGSQDTGVPPIVDALAAYDFETDEQGWISDGTVVPWTRQSPGHGSGEGQDESGHAFGVAGPTQYVDNEDTSLVSPAITVPDGRKVLEWSMRLETESGFDTVDVDVSSDAGDSWNTLGTYSGTNPGNPGWSEYRVLLPAASGPVQVRFHLVSDSVCSAATGALPLCTAGGYDGVHVDDVRVGTP